MPPEHDIVLDQPKRSDRRSNPNPRHKRQVSHSKEADPASERKAVSPETRNLSDAATPPKEGQAEHAGKMQQNWRLSDSVVTVQPSGFSDDSEDEHDLFSDDFREQVFGAPIPGARDRETGSRLPSLGAAAGNAGLSAAEDRKTSTAMCSRNIKPEGGSAAASSCQLRTAETAETRCQACSKLFPTIQGLKLHRARWCKVHTEDTVITNSDSAANADRKPLEYDIEDNSSQEDDPSKIFFAQLARRLSQNHQAPSSQNSIAQKGPNLEMPEFASAEQCKRQPQNGSDEDGPTKAPAPETTEIERVAEKEESEVKSASFEYELTLEDMDQAVDHGSQFHCYGDVDIDATSGELNAVDATESCCSRKNPQSQAKCPSGQCSYQLSQIVPPEDGPSDSVKQDGKMHSHPVNPPHADGPLSGPFGQVSKRSRENGFDSVDSRRAELNVVNDCRSVASGREITFTTGMGKPVNPSQESITRATLKYSDAGTSARHERMDAEGLDFGFQNAGKERAHVDSDVSAEGRSDGTFQPIRFGTEKEMRGQMKNSRSESEDTLLHPDIASVEDFAPQIPSKMAPAVLNSSVAPAASAESITAHTAKGLNTVASAFSYHLQQCPADGSTSTGGGDAYPVDSFKSGSGKALALNAESLKRASSVLGGLLGELRALEGADSRDPVVVTASGDDKRIDTMWAETASRSSRKDLRQAVSSSVPPAPKSSNTAAVNSVSHLPFEYHLPCQKVHGRFGDAAGFQTSSGRSLAARPASMSKAASIFGNLLGEMQQLQTTRADCVLMSETSHSPGLADPRSGGQGASGGDDGPTFTTGCGKVVQPSQASVTRAASKYGGSPFSGRTSAEESGNDTCSKVGPIAAEHDGPIFSTGMGKVKEPRRETMLKANAAYGVVSGINTFQHKADGNLLVPNAARSTSQGRSDFLSSSLRPLVPKFGQHALDSPGASGSHGLLPRCSSSSVKRPAAAAINDRRAFKVPRKLSIAEPSPLANASLDTSRSNASVNQSMISSPSVSFDTPHTPGLVASTGNLSVTVSGKALATPKYLFSPESAMKISGFRVTNAALLDASLSSTPGKLMLNSSLVGGTSATRAEEAPSQFFQMQLDQSRSERKSVPLKDAVEKETPFSDWTNGNIPIDEYKKIIQISRDNAAQYRFTKGTSTVFATSEGCVDIGVEEMHGALQERSERAGEICPQVAWTKMHYNWIVWKLAAMERAFPSIFGGRWLTPDRVILQLLERYDKEVLGSTRSVLTMIKQRDMQATLHLVLCVSGINAEDDNSIKLELMDGWNSIQAVLSPCLSKLVRLNKIFVGQKLRLYGSETLPQHEGQDVILKIGCNGVRRAEWHAKLGATSALPPFVSIRSVKSGEGVVPAILVVVQRLFPLVHMETLDSGDKLWRSSSKEEDARTTARQVQRDEWDHFLAMQMKLENMEGDAETLEEGQERRDKIEQWHKDFLKQQVDRKVCAAMRCRVACLSPSQRQQDGSVAAEAFVTFWRPQEGIHEDVREGAVLELYNLSASSVRKNGLLCLSSMKGTKCRRLSIPSPQIQAQVNCSYNARRWRDVSQLHVLGANEEFDLVGVVVAVSDVYPCPAFKGPRPKQTIVLTWPNTDNAVSSDYEYVLVRLDLIGLNAVRLAADRAGKRQGPAVLALKNLQDLSRAHVHGQGIDCNVFTCQAFEDVEILFSAPQAADGSISSGQGFHHGGSIAEHWAELDGWIKQSTGEDQTSTWNSKAQVAQQILQALGQGRNEDC